MRPWIASRAGRTLLSLLLLGAADAQAQNLVQNPGFDSGFTGWTIAMGLHEIFFDPMTGNAAPGSAFINMTTTSATNAFVVSQCIPATGGNTYDVGGSFRFSSSPAAAVPIGSVYVTFFSDPGCVMQFGGAFSFQTNGGMAPSDTWLTANSPGSLVPPAGTAAVRLTLVVFTNTAATTFGWFDDINLALTGGYFTVAPCRLVDTRGGAPIGGPALAGQQNRVMQIPGNCGIPATAKALSVNLAVTQSTAAGNVRLFPANQPVPTVSSINYGVGQTRANNAIVQLDPMGAIGAFVGQPAGTTVHLILDVNGYFE